MNPTSNFFFFLRKLISPKWICLMNKYGEMYIEKRKGRKINRSFNFLKIWCLEYVKEHPIMMAMMKKGNKLKIVGGEKERGNH